MREDLSRAAIACVKRAWAQQWPSEPQDTMKSWQSNQNMCMSSKFCPASQSHSSIPSCTANGLTCSGERRARFRQRNGTEIYSLTAEAIDMDLGSFATTREPPTTNLGDHVVDHPFICSRGWGSSGAALHGLQRPRLPHG